MKIFRNFPTRLFFIASCVFGLLASTATFAQEWTIGMSSSGKLISAMGYQADSADKPTVVLIGGLDGSADTSEKVLEEYRSYVARDKSQQPFNLIVIPSANP